MLDAPRAVGLDRINGNFVRTARFFGVAQVVVHNQLPKPYFVVSKEDIGNTYYQKGILHLSVADLGRAKFPAGFEFDFLERVIFPARTVFSRPVEIGSIRVEKGVVIGGGTKIGAYVVIGEGAQIGPNCRIEFSKIGKGTKIGADSKMRRINIGENTELGPGAFIDMVGMNDIQIESSVKIGAGLRIPESNLLKIESGVVMGDNVTISPGVDKIGARAQIGNGTLIQAKSIPPGETIKTKDAPDIEMAFRGKIYEEPAHNPHLPKRIKRMIAALRYYRNDNYTYDYTANCTRAASKSMRRDPALFLYPQLHSIAEDKLVRIVGEREALVFFHGHRRIYFGAKEIPEDYIAEERKIEAEEYTRYRRFSTVMLTGCMANRIADDRYLDGGENEDCYGTTPLDKFYMLMDYLRVKLGWSDGQAIRFLDMGSGLGDVVKAASAFVRAEGIEADQRRHSLALQYAPKSLRPNLYLGDFFNHDLSVYDLLYLHLSWGQYDFTKGPFPFIKKLLRKLRELKPEAMLIMGPIRVSDSFYDISVHNTPFEAERILTTMTPVDFELPDEIGNLFALFHK